LPQEIEGHLRRKRQRANKKDKIPGKHAETRLPGITGPRSHQVAWRPPACTRRMKSLRQRREDENKQRSLAASSLEPHGVLDHGKTSRSACARGNNARSGSRRVCAPHRRSARAG
jgi:hypothetical protein